MRYIHKAQSLSEVIVIITLVSITSIVFLTLFGNNLGELFKASKINNKPLSITSNTALSASTALEMINKTAPIDSGNSNASSYSDIPITLNQSNFTSNVATSLETVGANGATNAMLQNLILQAQAYKANGTITTEEFNNVMTLVQSGYRIANAEKAIEDAIAKSNNSANTLANTPVEFEGKTYTVGDLAKTFDFIPDFDLTGELFKNFDTQKTDIMGKIADPTAKEKMTILSDQILSVANSFSGAVYSAVTSGSISNTNEIIPQATQSWSLDELNRFSLVKTAWNTALPEPPSNITNNNSNAICQTANNTNGSTCQ